MISEKLSFINKQVIRNILSVFTVALIITLFGSFYVLGLVQGFLKGQISENERIAAMVEEINSKPTPTPLPTLTPLPTKPPKTIVVQRTADWGGPQLWDAVNARRVENGVNPLQTRTELCTIASIRLNELLELGKLDNHEGFSNMPERREDLKWIFEKYGTIAEFLAVGGKTPEETVDLWENTLGHSKLLKGGEYVWGCIYAQNSFSVAIAAY